MPSLNSQQKLYHVVPKKRCRCLEVQNGYVLGLILFYLELSSWCSFWYNYLMQCIIFQFELLQLMLSHCPEKRPTTYGIRARPPLNQYTKNVNVDDQWHFDLPPLRRELSKTSSISSSSTGSWEQVWNNHILVIWCSLSTTDMLVIYITGYDICVMLGVSILFIKVAITWIRVHLLPRQVVFFFVYGY